MKRSICIFGAGAIGCYLAASLARAGLRVSLVARSAQAEAIRRQGVQLITPDESFVAHPSVVEDAATLEPQDLLIVTLKAQALPAAASTLARLAKPGAPILFVVNGIPWWYFHGLRDNPASYLPRLDPQGLLWRHIPLQQVVGGVISAPCDLLRPGVVRVTRSGNQLLLGVPDDRPSERLWKLVALLQPVLPGTQASTSIRRDIWRKLTINLPTSLISTLTLTAPASWQGNDTIGEIRRRLVDETLAVAAALGIDPQAASPEPRSKPTQHYPSMLQDLIAGKPLEIDAQLLAVQDLARQTGTAAPLLDLLLPLLQQRIVSSLKVG